MKVQTGRPPQGVAARSAAVRLLHGVTVLGRPLDQSFGQAASGLSGPDRALARALVSLSLRNLAGLDQLIDSACSRPLPPDARARQALRIALTGRLLLDTPPHAVIATILPLLEGGPRRLVHGVLSTLFRQDALLPPPAVPEPFATRWREAWGEEAVEAAGRMLAAVPPTDLCIAKPEDTHRWAEQFGGRSLFPGHVRLAGSQAVPELTGFADGSWWVQDIAAQLPARLLGDIRDARVLDLCAAPGGKTMQLAAAGAQVTAVDISRRRMQRLTENLERTGLQAETIVADALTWQPDSPFDAILLDAPCSATGTFRRHPDVLWLKAAMDLAPLVELQQQLLTRAAAWLRPGGRLVAAVCSLEPEEGEERPAPPGLLDDPISSDELPGSLEPNAVGHVRTLPGLWEAEGGTDGFHIARYRMR
ncbi:MAG: methyltransferase domain-containing protein [Sphingomonadaceae bacterium]